MQKEPKEVQAEPGDRCCERHECWYDGYCHGETERENRILVDDDFALTGFKKNEWADKLL